MARSGKGMGGEERRNNGRRVEEQGRNWVAVYVGQMYV